MQIAAEQLDEALALVNKNYIIDGGHFEIAREKYHKETLRVYKEVFFVDEPMAKSLQLDWSCEYECFINAMIKQNLTLIAVDDVTDEIMGIRVSTQTRPGATCCYPSSMDSMRKAAAFIDHIDKETDFYNRYGVSEAIEFFALATVGKYRKLGLGTQLMAAAVDLFKYLKLENVYIKSIATSNYSQKIFEKQGFENVYQIEYKDYIVDGEVVFKNTGVHSGAISYVLKL